MAAIGGSIVRVAIRGRTFGVAADADVSVDLGGWQNTKEPNGDGKTRTLKTRKGWSATGLTLSCDNNRDDQGFLQGIANLVEDVSMSIEYADGSVYAGVGTLVDKLEYSTAKATCSVSMGGDGELEKQS